MPACYRGALNEDGEHGKHLALSDMLTACQHFVSKLVSTLTLAFSLYHCCAEEGLQPTGVSMAVA